jgi:glycerophosphoryl diester phosphodiesterase
MPSLRHSDRGAWPGRRQPHDVLVPEVSDIAANTTSLVVMTERRMRRVGHKGADLIAPGNTYASFDAALAAGVDMIEFDVLPERGSSRLVLAHDYEDAANRSPHTLDEGLAHLSSDAFSGVELDVDLKLPGYELRVLDALQAHGLVDRALISTQYGASMKVIRAACRDVRIGWSVPRLRRDPTRSPFLLLPALAALQVARVVLPRRAGEAIRSGRCDALMAQWRFITPALVDAVRSAGGELYAWTVDELPRLRALEALGVTGVISNDPRLFGALAA